MYEPLSNQMSTMKDIFYNRYLLRTIQQQRFELHGSTYMWVFSVEKSTVCSSAESSAGCIQVWGTMDTELWVPNAHVKLHSDLSA